MIGLGSGDTVFAIGGRRETQTIDSIEIIAPELQTLRVLDQTALTPAFACCYGMAGSDIGSPTAARFSPSAGRYDIIEADALRPTSAFSGNLYSLEYFALLRDHLILEASR